jgi:hypothetical protein
MQANLQQYLFIARFNMASYCDTINHMFFLWLKQAGTPPDK